MAYVKATAIDEHFVNPLVEIPPLSDSGDEDDIWDAIPGEDKPYVSTELQERINRQRQQIRRWKRFAETGEAPDDDSEPDIARDEDVKDPGNW